MGGLVSLIEVELIYNVMLVSGIQQSNSVFYTHTHMYISLFVHILFHCGLLQDIEYSSLCYSFFFLSYFLIKGIDQGQL